MRIRIGTENRISSNAVPSLPLCLILVLCVTPSCTDEDSPVSDSGCNSPSCDTPIESDSSSFDDAKNSNAEASLNDDSGSDSDSVIDANVNNSCAEAQALESSLRETYGDPDYSCVTFYESGISVDVWCCSNNQRIVYFSAGWARGGQGACTFHGHEAYTCDSIELPEEVINDNFWPGGCEDLSRVDAGSGACIF